MKRTILVLGALAATACAKKEAATDTSAAMATPAVGASTQPASPQPPTATPTSGLADPNAASREQLAGAGLDQVTITKVVAGRPYTDMVAFDKTVAASLNSDQRKALYSKVWKPIDLNTAKGDEILMIPGVGPKMRHEFEEYRPYKNIEQFRREIGKYVDKAEVARLEQYVTVK